MLRSTGWIVVLLMAGVRLRAQDVIGQPKFDLTSHAPEVEKMRQNIDVPVTYFTGTANISIPVHVVTSRGNKVSITLDYHTGGIKAEEMPGNVGLGWALTCGGSISRTVRGNKDEGIRYQTNPRKYTQLVQPTVYYRWDSPTDSMAYFNQKYGGYYIDGGNTLASASTIYTAVTTHNQTIAGGNDATSDDTKTLFNGLEDGEPDLFYFNFGAYSGKFVFAGNRTPILLPYNADLKITPTVSTFLESYPGTIDTARFASHYFSAFKISTPDGKDYFFGDNDTARINTPNADGFWTISGWLLTKVVDRATQDTVVFSYGGASGTYTKVHQLTKFITHAALTEGCANWNGGLGSDFQPGSTGNVKKIVSSKEVLTFYYSAGLDSIISSDRITGVAYKRMQFDHGGFLSKRGKLIGFTVKDMKTNEYFPYSFNYYDTAGYGGPWSQDYWGYHNGANNQKKLFPSYPTCDTAGANREAAWPAMKIDALTEIIYPTGGKTILDYEPNQAFTGRKPDGTIVSSDAYFVGAYNNFSLPHMIGGMRIKRILRYDPVTKDTLIQHFSYLLPGSQNTSGFLYVPPKLVADVNSFSCPANTSGVQYYIATHPVYQGSGSSPHISYTNVQVQEEKNGLANGHTEYDFYDDTNTDSAFYANALTDSTNSPLASPYEVLPEFLYRKLPENFLLGKEKEKRVYNTNGDLLLRQRSVYRHKVYGSLATCSFVNSVLKQNICGDQAHEGSYGGNSEVYGTFILSYDNTNKDSMSHGPTMTFVQLSSNGGNRGKPKTIPPQSYYFYYPYKTSFTAVQLGQTIVENHPSPLAYTIDTTTYSYDNAGHTSPTMITTRSSRGEVTQQRTLFSLDFNDVNSGDSTFYFMRLAGMNVPVATFAYRNGVVTGGGYKKFAYRSRKDSTTFLPMSEYSLNVQAPGISPASINLGSALPQALNFPAANFSSMASYVFNADNTMKAITKKGSDKLALLWDYNSNYVVAQAVNADTTDIAFTGFETSAAGNWTIGGTARVAGPAITGKQSYALSSGNITKTGLNTAKTYIVSYWSMGSAATVNSTAATAGNVKNGWHYFEHRLPAGTSSVTISGTVTIDELRLYPSDAQMTTYAFDPMIGVTASVGVNNDISYYEYDGVGRLRFVRDADRNILRAAQYFYTVYGADTAIWRSAGGSTRQKPCPVNPVYNTDSIQKQQVDINPNSSTFGTLQWVTAGNCGCDITAWQDTGSVVRCVKDASGNNTGYQEKEQKDMNPCSPSGNQTRWVSNGLNTTACPIPPPPCTGPDKRMINGVCVTGQRVNTGSVFNNTMQKFACTYHYEWLPDCIKGSDITEYISNACTLGNACVPQ